ncbi:hypothetical protein AE1304_05630 [Aeromonas enteropelogenes]
MTLYSLGTESLKNQKAIKAFIFNAVADEFKITTKSAHFVVAVYRCGTTERDTT